MTFLKYLHPIRAIRDLRYFLAQRKPYELYMMMAAMALTLGIIWMFAHDTHIVSEQKREIIYVKQWPANRTDEDIRKQQAIDLPAELARKAEIEKLRKQRQEELKRLDEKIGNWL
jgi:hypothetical protein